MTAQQDPDAGKFPPPEGGPAAPKFEIETSPNFATWLNALNTSLVFSAYQSSRLIFVGRDPSGAVATSQGSFYRCMGLSVHSSGRSIAISTKRSIIRLDNPMPPGTMHEDHDAMFVPNMQWTTGFIDAHDLAILDDKSIIFANSSYSCISTVSDGYSFKPLWHPAFITELVPEDRCHLNGLAVAGDRARFATAVSDSNVGKMWRNQQRDSGVLIDVPTRAVVLRGISMPHSPRWHDGKLWMLETGLGTFGYVDLSARKYVPIAFCPGFARGLALYGPYAVVCLSMGRSHEKNFDFIPLGEILKQRGIEAWCGLMVVDVRNGETVAWLKVHGANELYDAAFLPGVRYPKVIDFTGDEIDRMTLMDTRDLTGGTVNRA